MRATTLVLLAAVVAAPASAQTTAPKRDTRLVNALKAGDSAAALALLQQRIDVNAAEPDGTTPLHWAVRLDDLTLVNRLIRAGANVKASNRYGVTPLQLACTNGSAAAIGRLLEAGESANATGPYGETALMVCARTGKPEAAKVLLDHGATVDAVESWRGQTALMWATAQGHPAMMKLLIEAGADVNARSALQKWERQRTLEPRDKWLPEGGLTPLLFAAREGLKLHEVILLLEHRSRNNKYQLRRIADGLWQRRVPHFSTADSLYRGTITCSRLVVKINNQMDEFVFWTNDQLARIVNPPRCR